MSQSFHSLPLARVATHYGSPPNGRAPAPSQERFARWLVSAGGAPVYTPREPVPVVAYQPPGEATLALACGGTVLVRWWLGSDDTLDYSLTSSAAFLEVVAA